MKMRGDFRQSIFKRVAVLVCIVLAACSSDPTFQRNEVALESLQRIRNIASRHTPRLILRVTTAQPSVNRQGDIFLPETYLSRDTSKELTNPEMLMLPGGGGVLLWPMMVLGTAFVRGAEAVSDSSQLSAIERCDSLWKGFENDGTEWADATFSQAQLNKALEDGLRHRFAKRGLEHLIAPIVLDHAWTYQDIALIEENFRVSDQFVIIGDLHHKFDWGLLPPELSCGIRLTYDLKLYGLDLTPASTHPLTVSNMKFSIEVTDPKLLKPVIIDMGLAKEWVGRTVSELSTRIADLYFGN